MNNNNQIYGDIIAGLVVCIIVGWTLFSLHETSPYLAGALCLIIIGFIIFFVFKNASIKKLSTLEDRICKQLDKQGFRHEKQDGTLYVIRNDNHFRVQLVDGINKRIKHLFIIYDFGDDDFGKVTSDGWNHAANSINLNNTSTTFVALSDHFCCCYHSAIETSRDFMLEFDKAYKAIGGALEDYSKIYPCLERDYPNNTENKTIGFK